MFVVHGTRKFLDRGGKPTAVPFEHSTTWLGECYATVLFWKPQVALFVNESTLLPVLLPLAPATTVLDRLPAAVATVLEAHAVSCTFIDREAAEMSESAVSRRPQTGGVIGIVNEFSHLGRGCGLPHGEDDLVGLSLWLAETPCGPLYSRHGSPTVNSQRSLRRHHGLSALGIWARRDPGAATDGSDPQRPSRRVARSRHVR